MSEKKDITHLIERLEAIEERVGVRLEAIFAYVYIEYDGLPVLTVNGEVWACFESACKEVESFG